MEVIYCFYNKYSINILAIILSLLIVLFFNNVIKNFSSKPTDILNNSNIKFNNEVNAEFFNEMKEQDITVSNEIKNDSVVFKEKWYLEIEKIGLIAEIKEGTNEEVLDNFIGHFSSTPVKIGNVGLAAHNRGYKNNYFSKLKELEIGDEVSYYINGNKFVYKVEEILIIYETDWSMLENTKDNRITMITCIENREKYRLCVQAIRIKEE